VTRFTDAGKQKYQELSLAVKRITMNQIAELAGVSRTTVSYVLNNVPGVNISQETRDRIFQVARDLNYYPDTAAQSLASGHAGVVALVLTQRPHLISDAFLAHVVDGLSGAVKDQGFHVLIEPLSQLKPSANYGNLVRSRRADGIILVGPRLEDDELDRMMEEKIPLVLIGEMHNRDIPFVDVDNVRSAENAVNHLIALGHRRIACITNAPAHNIASQDRLKGYSQALAAANIELNPSLIRYGEFTDESGARAMRDILEKAEQLPTAVFAASDMVAFGALNAISELGFSVPEDIALVGFDDIPIAQYVSPPLTTVRLPAYDLGYHAGQMMMRLLQNPSDSDAMQCLLETELIIRHSCGGFLSKE
jgi:LacI family transcriptional regulator